MKANDWQDPENVRNLAISELAEVCLAMGLSWSATEKQFVIELPDVLLTPIVGPVAKRRKTFDISKWGDKGVDETASPFNHTANPDGSIDLEYKPDAYTNNMKLNDDGTISPIDSSKPSYLSIDPLPDDFQMPDYGEKLDEGVPPQGDPDAEA